MKWVRNVTAAAEKVAAGLRPASKFYGFLWEIRDELFADGFEEELMATYEPRGQEPCPPALLAMVLLLQRYDGLSDADAVDAAENDRRWQLVLSTLGDDKVPFGQGTLVRFRLRMIANDLDKKLVERTIEIAKRSKKFGWKKLRVALDSSPFHGQGRVEDTWNLIGRAMSKVVHAISVAVGIDEEDVIKQARLTALSGDSVKASIDIDWDDEGAQVAALQRLLEEVSMLESWIEKRAKQSASEPPLKDALSLLHRVIDQDIEPDPSGGGKQRLREGVAEDRVVSINDPEIRHGRKSRSQLFDGYKRHVAISHEFILATALRPANDAEHVVTEQLFDAAAQHGKVTTIDIDRGYLASPFLVELHQDGVVINSRPWVRPNQGKFTKYDFKIDLRRRLITCPAGNTSPILESFQVRFAKSDCSVCELKSQCTESVARNVVLHPLEERLIQLRISAKTSTGREVLRQRVAVEHMLARVAALQGNTARYRGVRKNELDLNRTAAIINLMGIARHRAA